MGFTSHASALLEDREKNLAHLIKSLAKLLVRLKPRSDYGMQESVMFLQVVYHCANVAHVATDCRQPFCISTKLRPNKHASNRRGDQFQQWVWINPKTCKVNNAYSMFRIRHPKANRQFIGVYQWLLPGEHGDPQQFKSHQNGIRTAEASIKIQDSCGNGALDVWWPFTRFPQLCIHHPIPFSSYQSVTEG